MPSTSLPPQAAQEAQALANASETLKAQAQTLKVHVALCHSTHTAASLSAANLLLPVCLI